MKAGALRFSVSVSYGDQKRDRSDGGMYGYFQKNN